MGWWRSDEWRSSRLLLSRPSFVKISSSCSTTTSTGRTSTSPAQAQRRHQAEEEGALVGGEQFLEHTHTPSLTYYPYYYGAREVSGLR